MSMGVTSVWEATWAACFLPLEPGGVPKGTAQIGWVMSMGLTSVWEATWATCLPPLQAGGGPQRTA